MKRIEGKTMWDDVSTRFGVERIYELSLSDESWWFDLMLCVYDPETNAYWFAFDSGCSCPSPFEAIDSPDDFEGPFDSATAAHKFLNAEWAGYKGGVGDFNDSRMKASLAVREHWEKLNADL